MRDLVSTNVFGVAGILDAREAHEGGKAEPSGALRPLTKKLVHPKAKPSLARERKNPERSSGLMY